MAHNFEGKTENSIWSILRAYCPSTYDRAKWRCATLGEEHERGRLKSIKANSKCLTALPLAKHGAETRFKGKNSKYWNCGNIWITSSLDLYKLL